MSEVQKAVLLHLPKSNKIDIEFENITFSASQGRKGKKSILKGISGKFKSGELTAIMGPSGAGKTSLLNILTGFQCQGMGGVIKSEGGRKNGIGTVRYKKESCYILQDDQLAPFFTVAESMYMAADLKLGNNISTKAKHFIVEDVLDTLSLTSCRDTRCTKLSGGQKKRLSIALELINNPPVMFLDEPTSGLDSLSSLQCITILKALAKGGRTIVCTIHQPSASMYKMFDHVYAMADGCCIYQGASSNTVAYLSSAGLNCPEYHNPADYLIEVANGEYGDFNEQLTQAAKECNWRSVYTSPKYEIEQEKIVSENGITIENNNNNNTNNNNAVKISPPSEWKKFLVLVHRSFLQLYRDWTVTHLKLFLHTLIGIFIGLFYLNCGNDASRIVSNFGYLIVTCAYLCYTSMMPAVLRFPSELPVLKKERFNNWYQLKTYYIAFMAIDIPVQMIYCASYTTISYFMSSQPVEFHRFIMFLFICCLLTITAESVGIFLSTVVNPVNGTFLGAISFAFMLVLAGFLVFLTHMSEAFYILSYVSYIRHAIEGMVHSIYGQNRPNIPCPHDAAYCHYTSPTAFLKEIGMQNTSYWFSVSMLLAMIVFLRVLAFCTLKRKLSNG